MLKLTIVSMAAIGLSVIAPVAYAWGEQGHRMVGLIAQSQLSDEARANLKSIMGSDDLATFALYMDKNKVRLNQQIPGSREWHYDDKPVCAADDKPFSEYCPDGNCASTQIARHYNILVDDHSTKAEKQFAVYVLSHLIGDIHQPLHVSDDNDRGGNSVRVKVPGSKSSKLNLHSAWDSEFIKLMYQGRSEQAIAKELVGQYQGQFATWTQKREKAWIAESHEIANTIAYGSLKGFACGEDFGGTRITLEPAYVESANQLIPQQLAKGGVRLAKLLNQALAN